MSDILVVWQGRFAGAVAPSTGKIMKPALEIAISLSQSLENAFQSWCLHRRKANF